MKRQCAVLIAVVLAVSAAAETAEADAPKEFFENLKNLCGKSFEGATQFPQDADHPMVGKKLIMTVATCSEREIRIPLQVGEDKSRTWVVMLASDRLLLKHDHRHADGTPDKQTNYGGWAVDGGTAQRQRFAADEETSKLIPEAASNVWTLAIEPEKRQFTYPLERNGAPRYEALFSLEPVRAR